MLITDVEDEEIKNISDIDDQQDITRLRNLTGSDVDYDSPNPVLRRHVSYRYEEYLNTKSSYNWFSNLYIKFWQQLVGQEK